MNFCYALAILSLFFVAVGFPVSKFYKADWARIFFFFTSASFLLVEKACASSRQFLHFHVREFRRVSVVASFKCFATSLCLFLLAMSVIFLIYFLFRFNWRETRDKIRGGGDGVERRGRVRGREESRRRKDEARDEKKPRKGEQVRRGRNYLGEKREGLGVPT